MEAVGKCEDPEWQANVGVNTFYPQGTTCFKDPSRGSKHGVAFRLNILIGSFLR